MSVERVITTAHIRAAEHRKMLAELDNLATDIGRCDRTVATVVADLNSANAKFQGQRNTRQEIEYLTILLDCAKKKLALEKQVASLQKRAPRLLEVMTGALNDPDYPPSNEMKAAMLKSLQVVQGALERLQQAGPPSE